MSDLKLFKLDGGTVTELYGESVAVEKSLQALIERHLEPLLGVRFLASEYSTGKTHAGRIDTLGIDENGCPVIIEYKRATNQNIINQGLFYLDWLLDHKAEFELLVLKTFGQDESNKIEWSNPRLLCIAGDFTKYDEHAVQQINRNIELLRYGRYGNDLLLLDLVNTVTASDVEDNGDKEPGNTTGAPKTVSEYLKDANQQLTDVYDAVRQYLLSLGDDVTEKTLKYYVAYRRIKNFACMEVHPKANKILVYAKSDTRSVQFEEGFTRDVTNIGHFGTGNLEITIASVDELDRAKPLLDKSYEDS